MHPCVIHALAVQGGQPGTRKWLWPRAEKPKQGMDRFGRGYIQEWYRRRDSTGAVYSRSLMFFPCLNSCALFAAYHDFLLKIVSDATFVAT
jgi:hypothetical protein